MALASSRCFLARHRGDARRHDLAALGNVALQELHVLVVDLRRVIAGERAGLAAAEEGPAGGGLRAHTGAPSLSVSTAAAAVFGRRPRSCSLRARACGWNWIVRSFSTRHGDVAQHVFVDLELALELDHGVGRRVDVQQHVMALAVLLDAVGEAAQAPIFLLLDLAAFGFDDGFQVGRERVHRLRADVLARDQHVLV